MRPATYIGNDLIMLETSGFRYAPTLGTWRPHMVVHVRDRTVGWHLLRDGEYERHTVIAISGYMKSGMKAVVIGSNYGWFDMIIAHLVGNDGFIYSFEPHPDLYDVMQWNLEMNGLYLRCKTENLAVTDYSGRAVLHTYGNHLGSSTLLPLEPDPMLLEPIKEFTIKCVTLDEYFGEDIPEIDLLKMDAEGSESAIVSGMERMLAERPPRVIVAESFPRKDISRLDYVVRLRDLGYDLAYIDADGVPTSIGFDELAGKDYAELWLHRPRQSMIGG